MEEVMAVLKGTRASEVIVLMGKLIGVGLFATLVYSYCNVLIEACGRGAL